MSNVIEITPNVRAIAESPRTALQLQVERHNGKMKLCVASEVGSFGLGELIDDKCSDLLADFVTVTLSEFGEALVARMKVDS